MSSNQDHFPIGETLDDGRFVFVELIPGYAAGLWRGREPGNGNRDVLITLGGYLSPEVLHAVQRGVPGIPPMIFVGQPDGQRYPAKRDAGWHVVVQECLEGESLSALTPLCAVDAVRVGIGLCDLVLAWANTRAMTFGLRLDTIFVTGDVGQRQLAGAIPHSYLILGQSSGVFRHVFFNSPNCIGGPLDQTLEDMAYTLGLILWRAATGAAPFDLGDGSSLDENMWEDRRARFTGDAELATALERVLVFDTNDRETVAQLRERLVAIATPQPG